MSQTFTDDEWRLIREQMALEADQEHAEWTAELYAGPNGDFWRDADRLITEIVNGSR